MKNSQSEKTESVALSSNDYQEEQSNNIYVVQMDEQDSQQQLEESQQNLIQNEQTWKQSEIGKVENRPANNTYNLEESSFIYNDQNETMMQPQTRNELSGIKGLNRQYSQKEEAKKQRTNRSVSFQDPNDELSEVFATNQYQTSEGRMSPLNFNEKQLRDLPDFDHALIQYHKQIEQERIEGNDMQNQLITQHALTFGTVPTKRQLIAQKIVKLRNKLYILYQKDEKTTRIISKMFNRDQDSKLQKQIRETQLSFMREAEALQNQQQTYDNSPQITNQQNSNNSLIGMKKRMTVVDLVHLDCQSQRIALNKDVDNTDASILDNIDQKHGTHALYDRLWVKIADRKMNLKSILKNHIELKDGQKRGIQQKNKTSFNKIIPGMNSLSSILDEPAQTQEQEEFNKEVQSFLNQRESNGNRTQAQDGGQRSYKNQIHCGLDIKDSPGKQHETKSFEEYTISDDDSDPDLGSILDDNTAPRRDKWTIVRDWKYRIWELWIIIVCFVTTLLYPYGIMNGLLSWDSSEYIVFRLLLVGELFMLSDIGVKFFLQEFDDDGISSKQQPLNVIAHRYLHSGFILDLIAFIPFPQICQFLFNIKEGDVADESDFKVLWIIKIVRIAILNKYLSEKFLLTWVNIYIRRKQKQRLKNEITRHDFNQDHIFVQEKINLSYYIKLSRLFTQILTVAYFVGCYWLVMVEIFIEDTGSDQMQQELQSVKSIADYCPDFKDDTFMFYDGNWDLRTHCSSDDGLQKISRTHLRRTLTGLYFAMTSLTTVGFGDYYPVTNLERLAGAFVLLSGVATFSYFQGELHSMFDNIMNLEKEFGDHEQLVSFFGLLRKFNHNRKLPRQLTEKITNFLGKKWTNDPNNFLMENEDQMLFDQLPSEVRTKLFTQFMFNNYLWKFRRFFHFQKPRNRENAYKYFRQQLRKEEITHTFQRARDDIMLEDQNGYPMDTNEQSSRRGDRRKSYGLQFPYYDYNDEDYCKFMILLMKNLECREYKAGEIFIEELDECSEILFVTEGKYDVGFQINNVKYWRRQFGHSTVIGGFQMAFQKRFLFNYRASTKIKMYSIRRKTWKSLTKDFDHFNDIMVVKFAHFYLSQIFQPLMKIKQININFFDVRKDYEQIMVMKNNQKLSMEEELKVVLFSHYDREKRCKISETKQFQKDIYKSLSDYEELMEKANYNAVKIVNKTEKISQFFWQNVRNHILKVQQNKGKTHAQEVHSAIYNQLVTFESQISLNLSFIKSVQEIKHDELLHMLKYYSDGETLNPFVAIQSDIQAQRKQQDYLERFMQISLVRRIHGKDLDIHKFMSEFEQNDHVYMKELQNLGLGEDEIQKRIRKCKEEAKKMKELIIYRDKKQKIQDYQHYSFHKQAEIHFMYSKFLTGINEKHGAPQVDLRLDYKSQDFKNLDVPPNIKIVSRRKNNLEGSNEENVAQVRLFTHDSSFTDMQNDQVDQINAFEVADKEDFQLTKLSVMKDLQPSNDKTVLEVEQQQTEMKTIVHDENKDTIFQISERSNRNDDSKAQIIQSVDQSQVLNTSSKKKPNVKTDPVSAKQVQKLKSYTDNFQVTKKPVVLKYDPKTGLPLPPVKRAKTRKSQVKNQQEQSQDMFYKADGSQRNRYDIEQEDPQNESQVEIMKQGNTIIEEDDVVNI